MILRAARAEPFNAPYLLIASLAYSEQDGVNLQLEGKRGDIMYLYNLMISMNSIFML